MHPVRDGPAMCQRVGVNHATHCGVEELKGKRKQQWRVELIRIVLPVLKQTRQADSGCLEEIGRHHDGSVDIDVHPPP